MHKNRKKYQPVRLENCAITKGSNFNLFSLSRQTTSGWMLKANASSIEVKKGGATIKFDIVLRTMHGALYCAMFN